MARLTESNTYEAWQVSPLTATLPHSPLTATLPHSPLTAPQPSHCPTALLLQHAASPGQTFDLEQSSGSSDQALQRKEGREREKEGSQTFSVVCVCVCVGGGSFIIEKLCAVGSLTKQACFQSVEEQSRAKHASLSNT